MIMLLSFVPATPTPAPTADHAIRRFHFAHRAWRDRIKEEGDARVALCTRLAQENAEYRQLEETAHELQWKMGRLSRRTDAYKQAEQEMHAANCGQVLRYWIRAAAF